CKTEIIFARHERNIAHCTRSSNMSAREDLDTGLLACTYRYSPGCQPGRRVSQAGPTSETAEPRFDYFLSLTRVNTPRASLSKLSALPFSPIVNVVTEGV